MASVPKAPKRATPNAKKPKAAKPRAAKASARPATDHAHESAVETLTPKQQRFVDEYLVDNNATQAAIRAGYSAKTARQQGAENLSKPVIQSEIAEARKRQQQRTEITADRVLREAWNQVTADARELTQLHIGCCRYCHGEGHQFQRTRAERDRAYEEWEAAEARDKPEFFDEAGGIGFSPNSQPHPDCPECAGRGIARVVLMDTRNLSPSALSLFAGVKQTKFGIEIQFHSKDAAMEKLFKHLGLYEKDNEQKTDPLTSLLHTIAKGNGNAISPVANDPEHVGSRPSAFGPVANVPADGED